jgi:COMPASS component SWD2
MSILGHLSLLFSRQHSPTMEPLIAKLPWPAEPPGRIPCHIRSLGDCHGNCLAIHADSPPLRCANYDKPPFAIWDMTELEQRFLGREKGEWTKIEFTNDGKNLLLATNGSGHFILDAFSGDITHFCYRKAGPSGRLSAGVSSANHGANMTNGNTPVVGQGDVCLTPDGQYLIGGSSEEGLLVWDISQPPSPNNILEPTEKLPGHGKSAIVGYNPRTNLLASADKDLYLWQPDSDLMI